MVLLATATSLARDHRNSPKRIRREVRRGDEEMR
jgi:hypothetical protein